MAALPTVHVFSKIAGLITTLRQMIPNINLVEIPYGKDQVVARQLSSDQLNLLREAEILIGDPVILGGGVIDELTKLKWMQSTWAGCDALMNMLDSSKPKPNFLLTRGGGLFDPHIAEWVVGQIISWQRNFSLMRQNQKESLWDVEPVCQYQLLSELSIGILGCGSIGKEVARACKAFGMTVWGMTRSPVDVSERCPNVDEYILQKDLPKLLQSCDYLCNVLPSTPDTKDLLSGDVLKLASGKQPVFMNVGRGDVVSEDSLINALRKNYISGAILDVFVEEPLPPSSQLWTHPNVIITPHVSGTGATNVAISNLFAENLKRYQKGEPLKHVLSWEQGY